MSEIWFTSDTHLGHKKVAELRGFEDTDEHDAFLAARWDKRVRDDDEVWVLGDIALGGWATRIEWFAQRPGIKHLVLGNHDRAHPLNKNAHDHLRYFLDYFKTVQTIANVRYKGGVYLSSHFPYDGEGATREDAEQRHTQWRPRDEGATLFHGHVHDSVKFRRSQAGSPMVHVGLDAWNLSPVNINDAIGAIKE